MIPRYAHFALGHFALGHFALGLALLAGCPSTSEVPDAFAPDAFVPDAFVPDAPSMDAAQAHDAPHADAFAADARISPDAFTSPDALRLPDAYAPPDATRDAPRIDAALDASLMHVTFVADVHPILRRHCVPCHATEGQGGHNVAHPDAMLAYTESQKMALFVAGTMGASSYVMVHDGRMPFLAGCSGDPVRDATNPDCLTAFEQSVLLAWLVQGQRP